MTASIYICSDYGRNSECESAPQILYYKPINRCISKQIVTVSGKACPVKICHDVAFSLTEYLLLTGTDITETTYENKNCTSPVNTETFKSFACVNDFSYGYRSVSYGDATPTSSSVPEKSCFSGSETVNMEYGGSKFISELRVGDRVQAADAFGVIGFSEVMLFNVVFCDPM